MVARQFRDERIDVRTDHKAVRVLREAAEEAARVRARRHGGPHRVRRAAVRVGRIANTRATAWRSSVSNWAARAPSARTNTCRPFTPNIYACGDVAGPYQFTHTASHQAWYAAVNALFGGVKRFRADYSVIPLGDVYRSEVARVGLNETEARGEKHRLRRHRTTLWRTSTAR